MDYTLKLSARGITTRDETMLVEKPRFSEILGDDPNMWASKKSRAMMCSSPVR